MTRTLAAVAAAFALVMRQLFCGHQARVARRLLVHPDGREGFACHCPACKANWTEWGKTT